MTPQIRRAVNEQNAYLLGWGKPTERDFSINDINRDLIRAMADAYGDELYLGRFNDASSLSPYDGGLVYNSQCDFCVPSPDQELRDLLSVCQPGQRWAADDLSKLISHIEKLGGHLLLWA